MDYFQCIILFYSENSCREKESSSPFQKLEKFQKGKGNISIKPLWWTFRHSIDISTLPHASIARSQCAYYRVFRCYCCLLTYEKFVTEKFSQDPTQVASSKVGIWALWLAITLTSFHYTTLPSLRRIILPSEIRRERFVQEWGLLSPSLLFFLDIKLLPLCSLGYTTDLSTERSPYWSLNIVPLTCGPLYMLLPLPQITWPVIYIFQVKLEHQLLLEVFPHPFFAVTPSWLPKDALQFIKMPVPWVPIIPYHLPIKQIPQYIVRVRLHMYFFYFTINSLKAGAVLTVSPGSSMVPDYRWSVSIR